MKKIIIYPLALAALFLVANCHSSKKAMSTKPAAVTYESTMQATIAANCSPCHIAGKGNKKPYDNYANLKADIDDVLRRIQLDPTERGFMPFKHDKLSGETIAQFKKWKEDGLLEK